MCNADKRHRGVHGPYPGLQWQRASFPHTGAQSRTWENRKLFHPCTHARRAGASSQPWASHRGTAVVSNKNSVMEVCLWKHQIQKRKAMQNTLSFLQGIFSILQGILSQVRNGKLQRHWKHSGRLSVIKCSFSTVTPKNCILYVPASNKKVLKTRVMLSLGMKIAAFISIADIINFPFPSAATLADYSQWRHKVILLLCVSPCQISLLLILGGFHHTHIFHTGGGCVSEKAPMPVSFHLLSLSLCLKPRLTISQLYPDYS